MVVAKPAWSMLTFTVTGTDKSIALPMVALAAYTAHNLPDGMEPGLKEGAFYDPTNFTFPAGCHICEVEVDPETVRAERVASRAVGVMRGEEGDRE